MDFLKLFFGLIYGFLDGLYGFLDGFCGFLNGFYGLLEFYCVLLILLDHLQLFDTELDVCLSGVSL